MERKIFKGTELKFLLSIESQGFSMINDYFEVAVKGPKNAVTIKKQEMVLEDDKFLFTVDTAKLGTGEYYATVTAYVPDGDFPDGLRTEVTKNLLCVVTS